MSSSPWKNVPTSFPADGATVWVRTIFWQTPPYQATWDAAAFTFTSTVNSAVAPWYVIAQWKPI